MWHGDGKIHEASLSELASRETPDSTVAVTPFGTAKKWRVAKDGGPPAGLIVRGYRDRTVDGCEAATTVLLRSVV